MHFVLDLIGLNFLSQEPSVYTLELPSSLNRFIEDNGLQKGRVFLQAAYYSFNRSFKEEEKPTLKFEPAHKVFPVLGVDQPRQTPVPVVSGKVDLRFFDPPIYQQHNALGEVVAALQTEGQWAVFSMIGTSGMGKVCGSTEQINCSLLITLYLVRPQQPFYLRNTSGPSTWR